MNLRDVCYGLGVGFIAAGAIHNDLVLMFVGIAVLAWLITREQWP